MKIYFTLSVTKIKLHGLVTDEIKCVCNYSRLGIEIFEMFM